MAAADLGTYYVRIMPSARGISGAMEKELNGEAGSAGSSAGKLLGGNLVGALSGIIAAAGIGTMFKEALDEAGNLQQSFGGLETIYGDAADRAKDFAAEAAAMGISANTYAEQAVSFGAALKQAYGGDTVAAAEAANAAIMAMADNSAKMGTDIGSVQNAFQGFARQNYTMLDNLKLGYGGTRAEMERLLADASELSGVEYNIDNLGDVYQAIGVIQENLGIAGVAAEEAKTTLTGSFQAMRAAATNLMGNLALGQDISKELGVFTDSVVTWAGNIIPLIGNVLKGLPQVLSTLLTSAVSGLNLASANMGGIVRAGVDIVTGLVQAIISALPGLAVAAVNIVTALGQALFSTDWSAVGNDLLTGIKDAMSNAAVTIFGNDTSLIDGIKTSIETNLPGLLEQGVTIVTNLANGLLQGLPGIITGAGQLLTGMVSFLLSQAPTILQAGVQLVINLAQGLLQSLPNIIISITSVMIELVAAILSHAPEILETGLMLLGELAAGIIRGIPDLIAKIPQIFQAIVNKFGEFDWISIGKNIIDGITKGLVQYGDTMITSILSLCSGAFDAVKNFFGIKSPSKLMEEEIGRWIPPGIAVGIRENQGPLEDAMKSLATVSVDAFEFSTPAVPQNGGDQKLDMIIALLARYLPDCAEGSTIDGASLMSTINRELGVAIL